MSTYYGNIALPTIIKHSILTTSLWQLWLVCDHTWMEFVHLVLMGRKHFTMLLLMNFAMPLTHLLQPVLLQYEGGIPEAWLASHTIAEIIDDVMGCQKGSVFCEGLVDCSTHDEFNQKLVYSPQEKMGSIWSRRSCTTWLLQLALWAQGYYIWGLPIREDAGLGCPPQAFTTIMLLKQATLSLNKVNYKHKQLIEFVEC